MINENNLKPVVIYDNGRVTHYFGSHLATWSAGYDPSAVLRVCEGKQKNHKGKVFCFIEDLGILGDKILAKIKK